MAQTVLSGWVGRTQGQCAGFWPGRRLWQCLSLSQAMPEQSGGKDHEWEFDFGGSESEAPPRQTGLWNVDGCSEQGLGWQLSWEVPSPAPGEGVWGEEAVSGMEPGGTSTVKGRDEEQEPVKEAEWSKHREEGKGVWCQGSRGEVLGGSGWSKVPKATTEEEKGRGPLGLATGRL